MVTRTKPDVIGVQEAADRLGINRRTVSSEIERTGALAGVRVLRVGGRWFIPRRAFEQILAGERMEDDREDAKSQ